MKIFRVILFSAVFGFAFLQTLAQEIPADVTLAKNCYAFGDAFYSRQLTDNSTFYYQKAADIYKQIAIESGDTVMWENHVRCLYDVSWNLTSQSEFEKSRTILDTAIHISLKQLGTFNKQTANIYAGLASVFKNKTEYEKALDYQFKCLEIRLKLTGFENLTGLPTMANTSKNQN